MTELYPWQENILNQVMKGGIKSGEMTIMTSGRNIGKSHFTALAIKRLMDDMLNRPVEDLVLSEGTVYGARYYCVEPVGGNWARMEMWCHDTYGEAASVWDAKSINWPDCGRWYMNDRRFWFRDDRDRTMFILRWR
jgi:uncharacterized protein YheU (UPF0270 family)